MTIDLTDFFRTLYDHTPEAVLALDADARIIASNPAAQRIFARDDAALQGRRLQSLFADPREYDKLARTYFTSKVAVASKPVNSHFRSQAGRVFDGEASIQSIRSDDGEPKGFLCTIRNVSEQRALRARLEASDLQLRAALSSAKEGAYTINLVTRLGSIRGFINEFLGIAATDATISLDRWLENIHPDDRSTLQDAIDHIQRKPGESLDVTYRVRRTDGEYRWLHDRGSITEFSRDGTALRLSGVISDVSERHALEVRLADSERMLREAISTTNEGAWELDYQTQIARVTGLFCHLAGGTEDYANLSRKAWLTLIHPDDLRLARSAANDLYEQGESTVACRVRSPEGGWIWINHRGRVTERAADGTPLRASGLTSDITERKILEDRIEESERLLREAMDGAQYGAWSLHLPSRVARYSGLVHRLLGGSDGGSLETGLDGFLDLLTPDSRQRAEVDFSRLQDGLSVQTDYEMVDRDGHVIHIHHEGRVVERDSEGRAVRAAGIISDITEERRLRSEVDESEERLRAALMAAGEGAWRLNLRTGIADISSVISEMMGLPPAEARISYDDWSARLEPGDLATDRLTIQDMRAGRRDQIDEIVRFRSETDDWIQIHNRGQVSEWDESGLPIMATGFMTDVTERMELAARLAERESQLADAVEAADVNLWRIDAVTDAIWLRGTLAQVVFGGEGEASVSYAEWMQRVHPDDLDGLADANRALLRGDTKTIDHVYRLQSVTGCWVWVRATGRITDHDPSGRITVISGAIQDIDRMTRLNVALTEGKRRFEHIYRATPAMMHTLTADGVITEVSEFWLSSLGYERDEVIGRHAPDFLDEESRERALTETLPKLFSTGQSTNIPYRFIRKSGEPIDVLLSSFLERDDAGEPLHIFAVMTDITPLQTAYDQLERSNRELDRFATVASHDLQEPLRKISAFSSLVRRRYASALDAEGERCLDFLVDAAQRMQGLIDDLLLYSKMSSQALEMDDVDLNDVSNSVRALLETQITESDAQFDIATLPSVRGDKLLLGQALQNLISNAVKYRGDAPPRIVIRAERDECQWIISVRDNGIGLDPRFVDKIFAPFQRLHTREEYKGTGIGLAIVRQAIERHGGEVWVKSEPGHGACFYFSLPAPRAISVAV
jgi:PAS domain S-box-containing protein